MIVVERGVPLPSYGRAYLGKMPKYPWAKMKKPSGRRFSKMDSFFIPKDKCPRKACGRILAPNMPDKYRLKGWRSSMRIVRDLYSGVILGIRVWRIA